MTTAADITAAYPKAAPIASDIVKLGAALGTDPAYIANVIEFESGFNPAGRNPRGGATGLIQFMPRTAARLGTTTTALRKMSAKAQFPYVAAYFEPYTGKLKTQADVYIAVFQPARLGQPLSTPLPAVVIEHNPGIRTLGDYVKKANARARLPLRGTTNPDKATPEVSAVDAEAKAKALRKKWAQAQARDKRSKKRALLTAGTVSLALIALVAAHTALTVRAKSGAELRSTPKA